MEASFTVRGAIYVGLAIILQSAGAGFGKVAAAWSVGHGLLGLVINPWYVCSLAALVGQAIAWMLALRELPLSMAYSFMSLVLPLNLFIAVGLFRETVEWNHAVGIALLSLGVAFSSRGVSGVPSHEQ